MIIANLATYPPRVDFLDAVIADIAPQVDLMNIVLNEFAEIPDIGRGHDNVNCMIPTNDTKDTGKFLIPVAPDDWLFTIDDDINYPKDYVATSIAKMEAASNDDVIGGYHGSIYTKHPYLNSRFIRRLLNRNPNFVIWQRQLFGFSFAQEKPVYVDQLGTGVAFMKGCNAPSFEAICHGQKFVDIAAARYWFEAGKKIVCFDRPAAWITANDTGDENIAQSFTGQSHTHVADEVYHFAYKRPDVGEALT